jgi:hypothetical protein
LFPAESRQSGGGEYNGNHSPFPYRAYAPALCRRITKMACCAFAQALGDQRAMEYMRGRKTLEINPDHPVIAALAQRLADSDPGVQVGAQSYPRAF